MKLTNWAILGTLAVLTAGCATSRGPVDLVATRQVSLTVAPSDLVEVSAPKIILDDGVLEVSGTITRKPGVNQAIAGHIDLYLTDARGAVLQHLPLDWMPREISETGARQSKYLLAFPWELPKGAVAMKLEYDDGSKCIAERRKATYASGSRMEAGVGLVPWGAPGAQVNQWNMVRQQQAHQFVSTPQEASGAWSPGYTGQRRAR